MFGCLSRIMRLIAEYIYSDRTYHSCKLKRIGTGTEEIRWFAAIPDDTMLCETVSKTYLGETVSKTKVWYPNDIFRRVPKDERLLRLDQHPECPWIWIGSGETDYTQKLSEYVVHGNSVTPFLLKNLFPEEDEWSYICSKTLDKKEFPPDGLKIK